MLKNQNLSSDFKIDEQRNQLALYRLFFGAGTVGEVETHKKNVFYVNKNVLLLELGLWTLKTR